MATIEKKKKYAPKVVELWTYHGNTDVWLNDKFVIRLEVIGGKIKGSKYQPRRR